MTPAARQNSCRRFARRGAILSMELVLILPLFLVLIFSIVEFSMLMSARTRIAAAASSGARMMSIGGSSSDEVQSKVEHLLGPALSKRCVVTVEGGEHAGAVGRVHVQVPMNDASPDLLWIIGFGLSDRHLEADAPMVMERAAAANTNGRF